MSNNLLSHWEVKSVVMIIRLIISITEQKFLNFEQVKSQELHPRAITIFTIYTEVRVQMLHLHLIK